MQIPVIGIAGTAKNTGKTTTTSALMNELAKRHIALGLTSIGYDGEELDNVTGLPKPRLTCQPGTIVAVASRALAAGTAKVRLLEETNITTPLGKIVYARVEEEGLVVIAGPNKAVELKEVVARLKELGAEFIIVDGALNRMIPMIETDGLILATGASRTPDIDLLAAETETIARLFDLPSAKISPADRQFTAITFLTAKERLEMPINSLLVMRQGDEIVKEWGDRSGTLVIPGVVEQETLGFIIHHFPGLKEVVVGDPLKMLVGGKPRVVEENLKKAAAKGIVVSALRQLPFKAITINPFFPAYRFESKEYEPSFVDADRLQSAIAAKVKVPVFNVKKDNPAELLNLLLK